MAHLVNEGETVNVLVPVGSLGAGARRDEVRYGLAHGAHAIASDAGSTDSGAAYLALGVSKNPREAVKADLNVLMAAQAETGIPLLIGSCGQAGGDAGVAWTRDIAVEVAAELGITPNIAMLYSEQDKAVLKTKNAQGTLQSVASFMTNPAGSAIVDAMGPIRQIVQPGTEDQQRRYLVIAPGTPEQPGAPVQVQAD